MHVKGKHAKNHSVSTALADAVEDKGGGVRGDEELHANSGLSREHKRRCSSGSSVLIPC